MDPKEFGGFVLTCRKDLGLSQSELAQKLGVTAKAISRWERGVGFPDIRLLEPLADALNITLIELMQSKRMEPSLPAERAISMVSDSVASIEEQKERTRKQKRDMTLGLLLIGISAGFLWCLGCFYSFERWWISGALRLIAVIGGILGCRAFYCIQTGSYLKPNDDSPWKSWKAWAACGIAVLGLVCCLWLKDLFPRGSLHHVGMILLGVAMVLPGAYWLSRLLRGKEEVS